jgi:hypothetical protein
MEILSAIFVVKHADRFNFLYMYSVYGHRGQGDMKITCPQHPATGPHTEADMSSPHTQTLLIEAHFNSISLSALGIPTNLFLSSPFKK